MLEKLIAHRRNLHRIPEIRYDLPKTKAYILSALNGSGAAIEQVAESGVLAYFDRGKPTTIAFRADMDALPISEQNPIDYQSEHEGQMHACGHDAHMAMLLGLADYLAEKQPATPHNILLIFQPAEESGGGAERIVQSGALERYRVQRIFALHVDPFLPFGAIGCRKGPMMAHISELNLHIHGRSAHIAEARGGADALSAGAELIVRAHEMERALPKEALRILEFGVFHSGEALNAVSAHTHIQGSMRAFDDAVFAQMERGLRDIAEQISDKYGVTIDINLSAGYPALINDGAVFELAKSAFHGMEFIELPDPSMLGEDFSFYLQRVPGIMFKLGLGSGIALHTQCFHFREEAMEIGLDAFIRLVHQKM